MTRHPADMLSLLAGLAVLVVGLVLLSGGAGDLPMEWVGPGAAIGLGVLVLIAARPKRDSDEDLPMPGDEA